MAEGVSPDCHSQLRVAEQLLLLARREEWPGLEEEAKLWARLQATFLAGFVQEGIEKFKQRSTALVIDNTGFWWGTWFFFGSHWRLGKEDIRNSQKKSNVWRLHFKPGITDSLPSELPYFGACQRPEKNKRNSIGSGMFHAQETWMTVSILVFWLHQWEIFINGCLFSIIYINQICFLQSLNSKAV